MSLLEGRGFGRGPCGGGGVQCERLEVEWCGGGSVGAAELRTIL